MATVNNNNSISTTEYNITDHVFNNNNTNTENNDSSLCRVMKFQGVIPWNNPASLISADTEDFVNRVKYTVVLPILFLIGGPANVINMAVFYRQGLKERINVCLFALSLVDFLYLFFNMFFYAEQAFLQISTHFTIKEKYGPVIRFMVNHNLLGFYGLPLVSQIISAIIATERCFCVLWPLRSQTFLSTTTTTVIIVVTGIVMPSLYSLVVSAFRAVCAHDPYTDSDIWILVPSQFFTTNQKLMNVLNVYLFGLGIPGIIIAVVVVATVVTMVKLRQAAVWRAGTSSSSSVSSKELGVTVMLVYNSIFFIVCVFPAALKRIVRVLIPELGVGKEQHNLSILFNWLMDIVGYINATFNILIYYTKGSRYRKTFWQVMARRRKTPPPPPPAAAVHSELK